MRIRVTHKQQEMLDAHKLKTSNRFHVRGKRYIHFRVLPFEELCAEHRNRCVEPLSATLRRMQTSHIVPIHYILLKVTSPARRNCSYLNAESLLTNLTTSFPPSSLLHFQVPLRFITAILGLEHTPPSRTTHLLREVGTTTENPKL